MIIIGHIFNEVINPRVKENLIRGGKYAVKGTGYTMSGVGGAMQYVGDKLSSQDIQKRKNNQNTK